MRRNNCKNGFGILLVLLGGFFLANNLLDLGYNDMLLSWKTFAILFGLVNIFTSDEKGFGLVMLTVGGFGVYAEYIGVGFWTVFEIYWPIFLLILGLGIILKAFGIVKGKSHDDGHWGNKPKPDIDDSEHIDITTVFSGTSKIITSEFFKGGKIVNIFGGTELDLSQTKLAEEKVSIDVLCLFGGVDIRLPNNQNVSLKTFVMFGGTDDERFKQSIDKISENYNLEIKGVIMFGGLELKN